MGDKCIFKLISFFFLGSLLVNSNSIVFVALYMLISPSPVTGGDYRIALRPSEQGLSGPYFLCSFNQNLQNLVCEYILGWLSVTCQNQVTTTYILTFVMRDYGLLQQCSILLYLFMSQLIKFVLFYRILNLILCKKKRKTVGRPKRQVQYKLEEKVWLMFSCFHLQNI